MNKLLAIATSLATAYLSAPTLAAPVQVAASPVEAVAPSHGDATGIARAKKAFGAYLTAWASPEVTRDAGFEGISQDAVFEYALARQGWTAKVEGKTAILEHLRGLAKIASNWKFSNVHFFPTLDPNVVFVQYEATAHLSATGQALRHKSIAVVEMTGDQIARMRELSNSQRLLEPVLADKRRLNVN